MLSDGAVSRAVRAVAGGVILPACLVAGTAIAAAVAPKAVPASA